MTFVHQNFATMRNFLQLSWIEFGLLLHLPAQEVYLIEIGQEPNIETMVRFSQLFHITIETLIYTEISITEEFLSYCDLRVFYPLEENEANETNEDLFVDIKDIKEFLLKIQK